MRELAEKTRASYFPPVEPPTIASLLLVARVYNLFGIFCVGQQTQLNRFARAHRSLAWMRIALPAAVPPPAAAAVEH